MADDEAERRIAAGDDLGAVARLAEVLAKGGLAPDVEAGLRLRRGTCFFRIAQFEAALAHAREAAGGFAVSSASTPHRADALHLAAECLRRLGRWAEAARAYREASEATTDPLRRRAADFLSALAEEEGSPEGAVRAWRAFLEAHEGDAEGEYRLGLVLERSGDLAGARASYARVGISEPEARAAALFRVAMIERKGGNLEAAIRRLEEATEAAGETFLGTTARSLAADLRGEWGLAKRGMRAYDPKS